MEQSLAEQHPFLVILDKVSPVCYSLHHTLKSLEELKLAPELKAVYTDDGGLEGVDTPQVWVAKECVYKGNDLAKLDIYQIKTRLYRSGILQLPGAGEVEAKIQKPSSPNLVAFIDSFSPKSIAANQTLASFRMLPGSSTLSLEVVNCDTYGARSDDVITAAVVLSEKAKLPVFFMLHEDGTKEVWDFEEFQSMFESKTLEGKLARNGIYGEATKNRLEEVSEMVQKNPLVIGRTDFGMFCLAVEDHISSLDPDLVVTFGVGKKTEEELINLRVCRILTIGETFPYVFLKGNHIKTEEFLQICDSGELDLSE